MDSLWGEEFSVTNSEELVKKILKKVSKPKVIKEVSTEKLIKSKNVSIEDKLIAIRQDVDRILGRFKKNTLTIRSYDEFCKYIDACISSGEMAIDTETGDKDGYGSLNTFDCNIMGLCLYTPGEKQAYIPVNHVNRETNELLPDQVTEFQIKEQLERCKDVFKIFHNATFDIEVINQTCGIKLKADWDTMVGAQLIDENEPKGLKAQYKLHIDPEQEKYDIEHLFKSLPYSILEPELFALYSAADSFETYQLYKYQKEILEREENKDVYKLFKEIEIPILDVVVDMELTGVEVDLDYAKKLSKVYHEKSSAVEEKVAVELERLKPVIDRWRLTPEANTPVVRNVGNAGDPPSLKKDSKTPSQKLADPPELSSPTQMAILLYDVLKVPVIDKKSPRGTGADILEALADKIPLCKLLVEKRGYDILINTFIDKMPEIIQKDGRVHARFNTCGTQTGRFSSNDPNLQNIPSHAKDIRMIFKAPKGYSLCGSDYSGQEMRVLASAAKDEAMIGAYERKQDIYATVASLVYKNDYADNLEFRPGTGEKQPEGKARRSAAKTVALGLNYGMSTKTLAERLGEPIEEAQKVVDGYYGGLTGVKKYTDDSQTMLKSLGYVTDLWGRRRHIPDGTLPEYEVIADNADHYDFNPLIGAQKHLNYRTNELISRYTAKLEKAKWKRDRDAIIAQAKKEGLTVKYNGGFISRAMRQCLNARIQGSSASMTKLAMIMAHNDPELNKLGFKLIFTVHDEFAGIAPTENSVRCGERLCELMVEAARTKCGNVAWSCDPYVIKRWYSDEFSAEVLNDYEKCRDVEMIKAKYPAIKPEYIEMMCNGTFDCNTFEDI